MRASVSVVADRQETEAEVAETLDARMVDDVLNQICAVARANPGKPYALFINEINRANSAMVSGEFITLIELDKRAHYVAKGNVVDDMEVQFPRTGDEDGKAKRFGVPDASDVPSGVRL